MASDLRINQGTNTVLQDGQQGTAPLAIEKRKSAAMAM